MALEPWRPRLMRRPQRELSRFDRGMEEMFDRFFRDWPWRWPEERGRGWTPAVDMIDRKDEIVFRADLPGLEQKDIDVTVQEGMLTIQGERKEEREEKDEDYYYCERSGGAFVRSFQLPPGVDAEKINATFKSGVLEVHLQKTKEGKAKKIDIKAA